MIILENGLQHFINKGFYIIVGSNTRFLWHNVIGDLAFRLTTTTTTKRNKTTTTTKELNSFATLKIGPEIFDSGHFHLTTPD